MSLSNSSYNFHTTRTLLQTLSTSAKLHLLISRCSTFHPLRRDLALFNSNRKFLTPLLSSSFSARVVLADGTEEAKGREDVDFLINTGAEENAGNFNFDDSYGLVDLSKRMKSPGIEVTELEELPEQWRRSRLAWLCKELPAHRSGTFTRVLNAQRKWIRQDDCTYIAVHCMRIRENEASFKVYKWMMQQHWFRFDFALATKLADYMGKEGKYSKCQEIFDDLTNQGLIPNESTFHILVVAHLSSSASNAVEQASNIYNLMINLGRYKPRLSLHRSLFRALVSKSGSSSRPYLKQAEFIFNNLTSSGLEVNGDIYVGLIWLHSYQEVIDKERIAFLRAEMKSSGIKENVQLLVSVLRACTMAGDLDAAERTWMEIICCSGETPTQAFVYIMEIYSAKGNPKKSLEIFRSMQKGRSPNVVTYYKIIEVLCRAQEIELAESLMLEFINSGLQPLLRSCIDLMTMYASLNSHEKVVSTFLLCQENCDPNQTVFSLYLDSFVRTGNLDKAEEIFNQMHDDETIGVDCKSCNTILSGYLKRCDHLKAEKMYDWMCQKKFDVESSLVVELECVLSLRQEVVKKPLNRKLSKEQREILVGLLLGGLRIELEQAKKNKCTIQFVFKENSTTHSLLKRHVYYQFCEWLDCKRKLEDDVNFPCQFATMPHSFFKFYAEQFWPQGQPVIPRLIHRWMTPRILAYWYMYSGHRTSSGDILLRLMTTKEDVLRIVKALKVRSLDCRVKRKGSVYWLGFLGIDAMQFWKLTEPFILMDLKESLQAGITSTDRLFGGNDANSAYEFGSD